MEKNIKMSLQTGPVFLRHSMPQLLELQGRTERQTRFRIGLWEFFGSQWIYWTNCCKLHCGCDLRKIVQLLIFVCWELWEGSVRSC